MQGIRPEEIVGHTLRGSWRNTDDPDSLTEALIDSLQEGKSYINIHKTLNPVGEICGQLLRIP